MEFLTKRYTGVELHQAQLYFNVAKAADKDLLLMFVDKPIQIIQAKFMVDATFDHDTTASTVDIEKDDGSDETLLMRYSTSDDLSVSTLYTLVAQAGLRVDPGVWLQVRVDNNTAATSNTDLIGHLVLEYVYV